MRLFVQYYQKKNLITKTLTITVRHMAFAVVCTPGVYTLLFICAVMQTLSAFVDI